MRAHIRNSTGEVGVEVLHVSTQNSWVATSGLVNVPAGSYIDLYVDVDSFSAAYADDLRFEPANASAPAASFTWTPQNPSAGQVVQFTDASNGSPTSWAWDFDGNGTTDATQQHPTYTYPNAGTYNVRLTVANASGSNSLTKVVSVATPETGCGTSDSFDDGVIAPGWQTYASGWSESGGSLHATNTTGNSPTEISWTPGLAWTDYTAEVDTKILNATGGATAAGLLIRYKRGLTAPPIQYAQCVLYQDASTKRVQVWAPGTSIVSAPFAFTVGTYYRLRAVTNGSTLSCEVVGQPQTKVSVTATSTPEGTVALQGAGVRADFDNLTVTCASNVTPPVANFTYSPQNPTAGQTVQFTDTSTGQPSEWAWDFDGNGVTDSTQQHPAQTYAGAATYNVRLTVGNSAGQTNTSKSLTVAPAPTCTLTCTASAPSTGTVGTALSFTASAQATNCTTTPTYAWTFGDGTTSTQQNPTKAYTSAGTHRWTMTASSSATSCARSGTITIATPSGDTDGDGLPDEWERNGVAVDGVLLDLPAMGANPLHKDIFVQTDYMQGDQHTHRPKTEAVNRLIEAFARAPLSNPDGTTGITLHIDCGTDCIMNPTSVQRDASGLTVTGPSWDERSRAQRLPHEETIGGGDILTLRLQNLPRERRPAFHYCIFAHHGWFDRTGFQLPLTPDFFVAVADIGNDPAGTALAQAGTFMHELGHALGLAHGGSDSLNNKPNYLSVMNYLFQITGLIKDGADGLLDYSRFSLPTLNESALDETQALRTEDATTTGYGTWYYTQRDGPSLQRWANDINRPIDWNGNARIDTTTVAADINDGIGSTLNSQHDWRHLTFTGGGIGSRALREVVRTAAELDPGDEITRQQANATAALQRISVSSSGDTVVQSQAIVTFTIANTGTNSVTLRLTLVAPPNSIVSSAIPTTITLPAGTSRGANTTVRAVPGILRLRATAVDNPNLVDEADVHISVPKRRAVRHPGTCAITTNPTTFQFPVQGGPGSLTITAPPNCTWTVAANDEWIHVTSSPSGVANGVVTFTVDSNLPVICPQTSTPPRSGTLLISSIKVPVAQAGAP